MPNPEGMGNILVEMCEKMRPDAKRESILETCAQLGVQYMIKNL